MINKTYIILFCSFSMMSCNLFQPESPNPEDFFIKMFGGQGTQQGIAVQSLDENTTYILGNTNAFSVDSDIQQLYLIKLDKAGNQVWAKSYNSMDSTTNYNNQAVQMRLTNNKNHLLLLSNETRNNSTKIRVVKVDLDGNKINDIKLNINDADSYEAANMSIIEGNSQFLIIGTKKTGTVTQIYATELNQNLGRIWQKSYNFSDRDKEFGVAIMEYNNNVIVVGHSIAGDEERPIIIEGNRLGLGEELQSKILFKNELGTIPSIQVKDFLRQDGSEFIVLCDINTETYLITTTINSEQSIELDVINTNPKKVETALVPISFSQTQDRSLLITGNSLETHQIGMIKYHTTNGEIWPLRKFGLGLDNLNQGTVRESVGSQAIEQIDGSILMVGTLDFSNKNMIGLIKTNANGELQ